MNIAMRIYNNFNEMFYFYKTNAAKKIFNYQYFQKRDEGEYKFLRGEGWYLDKGEGKREYDWDVGPYLKFDDTEFVVGNDNNPANKALRDANITWFNGFVKDKKYDPMRYLPSEEELANTFAGYLKENKGNLNGSRFTKEELEELVPNVTGKIRCAAMIINGGDHPLLDKFYKTLADKVHAQLEFSGNGNARFLWDFSGKYTDVREKFNGLKEKFIPYAENALKKFYENYGNVNENAGGM